MIPPSRLIQRIHREETRMPSSSDPVGLTLANDLTAHGVSFRLIDAIPEPTRYSLVHGWQ